MARTKTKTVVYAVSDVAPIAILQRDDLAKQYAEENGLEVFPITVLTEPDLRAKKRAAAMAVLTPEQQLHLGLVKKSRKAVAETGN